MPDWGLHTFLLCNPDEAGVNGEDGIPASTADPPGDARDTVVHRAESRVNIRTCPRDGIRQRVNEFCECFLELQDKLRDLLQCVVERVIYALEKGFYVLVREVLGAVLEIEICRVKLLKEPVDKMDRGFYPGLNLNAELL